MASRARLADLFRNTFSKLVSPPSHGATVALPALYVASRGMASSKLFVGGLAFATDERSLRDAFSAHGEVMEVKVILDRETGRSRGFGFVSFYSETEAETALQKMDGQALNGRIIRVNYAINKPREGMGGGFPRGYGPGDDGFMPSSFGRGPSGFGQDSSTGGTGLPSYGSGFASGGPSESTKEGGWNDGLTDTASKPTTPKKGLYDDERGPSWDDILNKKESTNASDQQTNPSKEDGWDNIFGKSSTTTIETQTSSVGKFSSAGNNIFGKSSTTTIETQTSSAGKFSSAGAKKDDWDFGFGNLDAIGTQPSPRKAGNSNDLKLDSWDDILGTKSETQSVPKPISSKGGLDSDVDTESDSRPSERQVNS